MSTNEQASQPKEVWASGAAYEAYMGRWSRLVAREFLAWLEVPPGSRWLDVGSGTGALSRTILELAAPGEVNGIDSSAGYVAHAQEQIGDERVHFEAGDAQALPVETGSYDAVVSGLMLNFVPQPQQAVAEMARAARPGGLVAVYVWDYAGGMEFTRHFRNAAAALDPAAGALDQGQRFPICRPEPLAELFRAANLQHVETRPINIPTEFANFEDYWTPFLGGQGAAPGYLMSLDEEQREALRERIRSGLPFAPDGSIPLIARAWAVRGTR